MTGTPVTVPAFETATLGFLVYLVGVQITQRVRFLRDFNIPEPVTGGILAALVTLAFYLAFGRSVEFDLAVRDYLLILFFSGIGLNARLGDLAAGGKPLLLLLGLTVGLIFMQNLAGLATALAFGLPPQLGVLLGSASLIGGHGTTIAWAPAIAEETGFAGALELGIASATLGLIVAALLGGPVAHFLIERNKLHPAATDPATAIGIEFENVARTVLTPTDLMRAMMTLHVVMIIGLALADVIKLTGVKLPSFVPCMLVAIAYANLMPRLLPRLPRVAGTPALALVTDFALGAFLAMSLMAMQLWTLKGLGLLMAVSIALQTVIAVAFVLFLLFRLMGRQYLAAVLSAGFLGFGLGATPTAIANMNAVTKRYGPAPLAFVILPLVSAFFVDLANAAVMQLFLAL